MFSAAVERTKGGVGSPHPANTSSLCCGDEEGGRGYLQQAGERQGNAERFIFPLRLRAFPRLASSGQHKPVL